MSIQQSSPQYWACIDVGRIRVGSESVGAFGAYVSTHNNLDVPVGPDRPQCITGSISTDQLLHILQTRNALRGDTTERVGFKVYNCHDKVWALACPVNHNNTPQNITYATPVKRPPGQPKGLPPGLCSGYPGTGAAAPREWSRRARGAKQNVDPFVTIPSGLLPRCPGTQKVALGEGPWAVQGAGSLDRGRVCYALRGVVMP
jgi:hypothetical protein